MEEFVKAFIERVKLESGYHKFLKEDLIYQFIDFFKNGYDKKEYPNDIKNPLEVVLEFYKYYNNQYYETICEAIDKNRIIISNDIQKSFVDTDSNETFIKLSGNDSDIFILCHEFAHFIDRNCMPTIIPNEYSFLCEVFSFYMERQLELWLDKKYEDLILARRNNRMYFESRMLNAIEYELFCEELYKESGKIKGEVLDKTKVKLVMDYDYDLNVGLVNYLLRYPLANVLSDYLINDIVVKNDADIYKICLNTNLYNILENKKHSISI